MAELIKFERVFRRAGGTLAVTIPPEIQRALGIREGQKADLHVTPDKGIMIQPKEEPNAKAKRKD